MRQTLLHSLLMAGLAFTLARCGTKTGLDFIVPPEPSGNDVSYVPVQPFLTGVVAPTAVVAGYDGLIYVADSATEQIVCYDEAGREQSRMRVPGVTALAQDRTLDILAVGRDVFADNPSQTLATIYRIAVKQGTYGLGEGKIVKRIQQPFFIRGAAVPRPSDFSVSFNGIAVLPNNQYYVTRTGPGQDLSTQTPYDAVLLFSNRDAFLTPITVAGDGGAAFSDFFKGPYAIATIPPKAPFISSSDLQDFLISTLGGTEDTVLRLRYITATSSNESGTTYAVRQLLQGGDTTARRYIYEANRFARPKAIAIASDESGYIFVTDRDSLYQFSPEGQEGVKLKASTTNLNYNKVSFGGRGNGPYQFSDPRGIAYVNRIVYVADKGNGRVCRYKLSSDFQ